jgi:hypothetical protein
MVLVTLTKNLKKNTKDVSLPTEIPNLFKRTDKISKYNVIALKGNPTE